MARIRSLKPGFFANEYLCELPFETRLLFEGLWLLADREGRLEDRPRRIKAFVFPYDVLEVDSMLSALAEKALIVRYVADGVAYLFIPTFLKHQRPKHDETASVIPEYVKGMESTILEIPRGNVLPPRPYNGQRTEDRGQRTGGDAADVAALLAAESLRDAWNRITDSPVPQCRDLSTKRRRHARTRLTERPLTEWEQVFQRIQASSFCRGENDRGWVATFDWVAGSPDVALKVLEGKYDDRKKPTLVERPFSAAEVTHAKRARDAWGGCRHEPRCENYQACLNEIMHGIREGAA